MTCWILGKFARILNIISYEVCMMYIYDKKGSTKSQRSSVSTAVSLASSWPEWPRTAAAVEDAPAPADVDKDGVSLEWWWRWWWWPWWWFEAMERFWWRRASKRGFSSFREEMLGVRRRGKPDGGEEREDSSLSIWTERRRERERE